jgi:O-succinylbenzoic acid--CoA ligase
MNVDVSKVWYWNGTPYSLAQIAQGNFLATDEAMQIAWTFAETWLAGKARFSLPTSGSTGEPKIIEITRAQMQASAKGTAKALDLPALKTALLAINPQYVGGTMMLVRALEYGLTLHGIPPVSNPLAYLEEHKIGMGAWDFYDFMALVPMQLHTIATETPQFLPALNQYKAIILGGGAVSETLMQVIQQLRVPIYNTCGMTETVSHIALKRLNGTTKTAYFEVLEGVQIAVDERSCLKICAEVTQNEWIQTNDVVEIIDHQRFIWVGRQDNVLNSGGIKIQIELLESKIEAILKQENIQASCAIVGLPDEKWQERVTLFLEMNVLPTYTLERLWALMRQNLLRHEVPKEIHFLPAFPRTETGKIRKKDLLQTI